MTAITRHAPPSSRRASSAPLFEALVCETHHAAAMTAIVASCIHGASNGVKPLVRTIVDRFIPPEPAVLLSLTRRSLLEIEPLTQTQDNIDGFFLSLRVLRRLLGTFFFDCGEIGAAERRCCIALASRPLQNRRATKLCVR